MEIYDNCGTIIHTTTIGPFSSNTTLPNITISTAMIQSTLVEGTLLKCDDSIVTNGYVMINNGTTSAFSSVTNGAFSFNKLVCTNTGFTLQGYDYENLQTTDSIHFNYTVPVTNVGNLKACTAIIEFISFKIDNNPLNYITTGINGGNYTPNADAQFYIYGGPLGEGIYISGNTVIPGIYTTAEFSINYNNIIFIENGTTNTISFNLSNFGAIGEYIDMTFNGTYIDGSDVSHIINGVAHVVRKN